MPRIDAGDVCEPGSISLDLGFPKGFESVFEVGMQIGKGGFGTVKQVYKRVNGEELACKILSKTIAPNLPRAQQLQNLDTIKREVAVLKALRGTLNVVNLDSVYEDDQNVYIVMEYCKGGELFHRIGLRPYSEETVARIMRAALRTLAQCHSHRILHRDVKPGNFMFLRTDETSPIKAVDFGLAVFYDPKNLPRRDLGFDGTPWFMAPEVLSSEVVPESDVWSAGVMAHQLLTGNLPFDDKKNRKAPALSAVWRAILTEDVNFRKPYWMGISEPAMDFVKQLLVKDPTKRPSAKEALMHPWVRKGGANTAARPFSSTIVQRIQRYGQSSVLKRTVLDMIANELVQAEVKDASNQAPPGPEGVPIAPSLYPSPDSVNKTWHNGSNVKGGSSVPTLSYLLGQSPDISPDVASSLNSTGRMGGWKSRSQDRRFSHQDLSFLNDYNVEEWEQRRKAARLALDTSVHGPDEYPGLVKSELKSGTAEKNCEATGSPPNTPLEDAPAESASVGPIFGRVAPKEPEGVTLTDAVAAADWSDLDKGRDEGGGRGQSLFKDFLQGSGTVEKTPASELSNTTPVSRLLRSSMSTPGSFSKRTNPIPMAVGKAGSSGSQLSRLLSGGADVEDANRVLDNMNLTITKTASEEELMAGLQNLGFEIDKHELALLIESMAPANDGHVQFSQFLASQLDWHSLQNNHRAQWLESVRQAFKGMDKDGDGRISSQDLIQAIAEKLPATEVEVAVEQAKIEACAEEFDMDFDSFVGMLKVDSCESLASLDQYDSRHGLPAYVGSLETVEEV
ncbi:hypothetical protein BSKO_01254 [Bryopsis sp. KO-2023]|nr:hypothetical protein BSKO_01254 [Bryopsis sp. KO-2023]